MAILDFLKNKEDKKKSAKKPAKVSVVKKEDKGAKRTLTPSKSEEKKEVKTEIVKPASKSKNAPFSYEAVRQPHISEKASWLAEKEQYTFEVSPNYNKNEIKKSVEGIYGVDVLSVNIIKIPAKKRRLGRTEGFRKSFVKAIVKIKEGQKIEIL
jgi:large subunit ribosomal protein L23